MGCKIRDLEVYCEVIGEGKPVVMVHLSLFSLCAL